MADGKIYILNKGEQMGKVKEYDKRQMLLNEIDKRDEKIMELEDIIDKQSHLVEDDPVLDKTVISTAKRSITIEWKEQQVKFHDLSYSFDQIFKLFEQIDDDKAYSTWKGYDRDFSEKIR
jgi:hypothetical protein